MCAYSSEYEYLLAKTDPAFMFFTTVKEAVMFALLEADGTIQQRLLGIIRFHYCSNASAYDWRTAMEHIVEDGAPSDDDAKAMLELNKWYNRMVGNR